MQSRPQGFIAVHLIGFEALNSEHHNPSGAIYSKWSLLLCRHLENDVKEALSCLASDKGLTPTAEGKVVEPITKLEFESVICDGSGADCKVSVFRQCCLCQNL